MPEPSNILDRLEELVGRLDEASATCPEFATVAEASRFLGIGVKALRGAIQRGEVPVYALGTRAAGRPRVHVPEVRAWALGTALDPLAAARAAGDVAARERVRRRISTAKERTRPRRSAVGAVGNRRAVARRDEDVPGGDRSPLGPMRASAN